MLKVGLILGGAYLLAKAREETNQSETAFVLEGVEVEGAPKGILRARYADQYQAVNLSSGKVQALRETAADRRRNRRRRDRREARQAGSAARRGRGPATTPEQAQQCGPAPRDGFVVTVVAREVGGFTLCVWFKGWSLRVENGDETTVAHVKRRLDSLTTALGRAQSLSPAEIREVLYWLAVATALVRARVIEDPTEAAAFGVAAAQLLKVASAKIPEYQG